MIRMKNFSGLHTPQDFGNLLAFTINSVVKPSYAPGGIRIVDLDIADASFSGRWIVSDDMSRGWKLALREFKNPDGQVVATHYLAEKEISVGDPLASNAEYTADFNMTDLPTLSDYTYHQCNFTQPAPDTSGANPIGIRLWPGDDTPRTFFRCNMLNCEPPPGSTVTKCLTAMKSFGLNGTTQEVKIDGVVVDTHQNKFNRVHGRREADGSYVYDQKDEDES